MTTIGERLYVALQDERVRVLLEAWGEPYDWAQGDITTPWLNGMRGYDCSGFAQGALVHLGLIPPSARFQPNDRGAYQLAMDSERVPEGTERLGDLAFYGTPVSHVMVVIAPGIVLGARGGGSSTHGDDPSAYVDLRPLRYRPLTAIGRLRQSSSASPDSITGNIPA